MSWITLTLLASFFFALENIVDKKISDSTKNTTSALFLMNVSKIPVILVLWMYWYSDIHLNTSVVLWSALIGLIATITWFLYLKAFQYGDASTVMPMYELGPLWSLLLSFLILGELPHSGQYIALIFLLFWWIIFSLQRSLFLSKSFKKSLGIVLIFVLVASFGYNLMYVLSKFVILQSNIETAFFLQQCFYIGFSIIYAWVWSRGNSLRDISHISWKFLGISLFAQSIGIFAFILYTKAFTLWIISLVNALASTQSLFVLILSAWLSIFVPTALSEKWDRFSLIQKVTGTIFIGIGVVLMYIAS